MAGSHVCCSPTLGGHPITRTAREAEKAVHAKRSLKGIRTGKARTWKVGKTEISSAVCGCLHLGGDGAPKGGEIGRRRLGPQKGSLDLVVGVEAGPSPQPSKIQMTNGHECWGDRDGCAGAIDHPALGATQLCCLVPPPTSPPSPVPGLWGGDGGGGILLGPRTQEEQVGGLSRNHLSSFHRDPEDA